MSNPNLHEKSLPSNPAGVTGKLSSWISTQQLSEIPAEVRIRAKYLILDGIACAFVGAHLPWSETATKAILNMEPKGDCTIIGWGADSKVSPMASALINSTFIQGFELDDVNMGSPLHNNSLLLPALLAATKVAIPSGSIAAYSGPDFLRSYIVGCEVGPRVGLALHGADLISRGWHSGTVMGPSATAAAVSSLLHLSPKQVEDALGIACTQAGGLMSAQFGSMAKRMQHGFACRNGLLGALLAQGGYTGIHEVYEQPYGGFLSCFSQGTTFAPASVPEEICKNLGTTWEVMRIAVKFHASMAALHGTIDAIQALQRSDTEKIKKLDQIKNIEIRVPKAAYEHGGWKADPSQPLTSTGAQMSIQYACACALIDGQVLMEQFSADKLNRPQLRELMQKVEPIHDDSYDKDVKSRMKTDLKITYDDGSTLEKAVRAPHFVSPGLSNEEIMDKWHKLVQGLEGMDDQRMKEIEDLVLNMENQGDDAVVKLTELLEGVVGSPIGA